MTSKDAYDIAARIVDISMKNLQLFIGICTLFGGWAIAGNVVKDLDCLKRFYLVVIFSAATGTMILGQISLLRRASAALLISATRFQEEHPAENKGQDPLFETGNLKLTSIGMGAVVIFIDLLILTI